LAPPFPETFEEVLQAAFAALPKPSGSQAEAADDPWTTVQEQGGWWGTTSAAPDVSLVSRFRRPRAFAETAVRWAMPLRILSTFSRTASPAFLDGSLAHLPGFRNARCAFDTMWSSWSRSTRRPPGGSGSGLATWFEVASRHATLRAAALLSPGIAPDVIAMPVGQGHQTFTRLRERTR